MSRPVFMLSKGGSLINCLKRAWWCRSYWPALCLTPHRYSITASSGVCSLVTGNTSPTTSLFHLSKFSQSLGFFLYWVRVSVCSDCGPPSAHIGCSDSVPVVELSIASPVCATVGPHDHVTGSREVNHSPPLHSPCIAPCCSASPPCPLLQTDPDSDATY